MTMIDTDTVIKRIQSDKIVAILRAVPENKLLAIADALYEGGVRLIECTFDHTRSDGVAANCEMIRSLTRHCAGRMEVGAGTVLSTDEVRRALDAGAAFIISPNVDEDVIRTTREEGAVSIPGALTPTEIVRAWQVGAHFVKLFPAGSLGVDYVKAVRAPLKHIPMIAVGGVALHEIQNYLSAGICGFGIGSPLLPKEEVERCDYPSITRRAAQYVQASGAQQL